MNITRLYLNDTYDLLFGYFGLPNSRIESIDDDETSSSSDSESESVVEQSPTQEIIYQTFFSQIVNK